MTVMTSARAGMSWIDLTPAVKLPVPTSCTVAWCVTECPGETPAETLHISAEHRVTAAVPGYHETHDVSVSLETYPGQAPAVRLQGAADAPMSPSQALELAHQLVLAARQAAGIPR